VGEYPDEILITDIMQKYGWTYEQYLDQPHWVIDATIFKMVEESEQTKKAEQEAKKQQYGSQ